MQSNSNSHPSIEDEKEVATATAILDAGEHDMRKKREKLTEMTSPEQKTLLLSRNSDTTKTRRSSTSDVIEIVTVHHKKCTTSSSASRRASLSELGKRKNHCNRPLFCNSFVGDVTFHTNKN